MKLFQVIFGVGLLARSHVVIGEDFLEVIPTSDGVLLQAEEPIICRPIKNDRKVIFHGIFVSACSFHNDLV